MNIVTPFTMMVSGPSGCGKTTFVNSLLQNIKPFNKILWCNAEENAIPINLRSNVEIFNGVPDNFDNTEDNTLIVLDDLMMEAYNKNVCELFIKGSHHKNLSVILINQNVFHQGKFCRDISLNCKYLVIFKNPRDKSQILPLARQIFPENISELIRVYKEVTLEPFQYLFLDLTQTTDDLLRFRTNIFNKNYMICYCPVNLLKQCEKNETVEGKQTYVTCVKQV